MKDQSQSDLSEEINDQLSQLWTNNKDKRRHLLSQLTPYSRKNQQSFNSSIQPNQFKDQTYLNRSERDKSELESQIIRLRGQLEQEVSEGKHKELQMVRLKKTNQQLAVQKKYLTRQLQQTHLPDQNCSKALNESSILPRAKSTRKSKQKSVRPTKHTIERSTIDRVQELSKERLVELVRSTAQYRSYVFCYDSNELSYLRRLNEQHKKNCTKVPGQKQKKLWAPTELINELKDLNQKQKLDLSEQEIHIMIARMKGMFEDSCSARLSKLKQSYQNKLEKITRANQNRVPYQLVQISRARERELSRWSRSSASMTR